MSKKNFMQVFADLHQADLNNMTGVVQVAPINTNMIGLDKMGNRCTVSIGIPPEVFNNLMNQPDVYIGGLILVDRAEYDKAKRG